MYLWSFSIHISCQCPLVGQSKHLPISLKPHPASMWVSPTSRWCRNTWRFRNSKRPSWSTCRWGRRQRAPFLAWCWDKSRIDEPLNKAKMGWFTRYQCIMSQLGQKLSQTDKEMSLYCTIIWLSLNDDLRWKSKNCVSLALLILPFSCGTPRLEKRWLIFPY